MRLIKTSLFTKYKGSNFFGLRQIIKEIFPYCKKFYYVDFSQRIKPYRYNNPQRKIV